MALFAPPTRVTVRPLALFAPPGKRFQTSVPEYEFGGKDISEVLAMSVAEAEQFLSWGPNSCNLPHPRDGMGDLL